MVLPAAVQVNERLCSLPTYLPLSQCLALIDNREAGKFYFFSEMLIQQQRRHTHTHIHHRQQQTGEVQYKKTAAKNCHQVEVVVIVAQVGSVNTSQCTALSCKRKVFCYVHFKTLGRKRERKKADIKRTDIINQQILQVHLR